MRRFSSIRIWFCLFILFFGEPFVLSQQVPAGTNFRRDEQMLNYVKEVIRENYFDKNFRGIKLDELFYSKLEKLRQSKSDKESLTLIASAVLEFDDSHTLFLPPTLDQRPKYGWSMKMIGDKCVVMSVDPGSDAEKQGLKVGDQIISLDGVKPQRDNIWKLEYFFHSLSPDRIRQIVTQSPDNTVRQLVISATFEKYKPRLSKEIEQKRKQDQIWREELFQLLSPDVALWKWVDYDCDEQGLERLFEKAKTVKKMILDLRGNPGGYVTVSNQLMSFLFPQKIKGFDIKYRGKSKEQRLQPPKKGSFLGDLIVLVDSDSASAAEILARLVQLEKRGAVVGDITSGSVMESATFVGTASLFDSVLINSSFRFGVQVSVADVVMPDGKSLERVGVTPDEVVIPLTTDIALSRDPVLAKVAQRFGVKLDSTQAGDLLKKLLSKKPEASQK